MTSRNKVDRLKRISKIAENNEKNQQIQWKLAKENLSKAEKQLQQLESYYKAYNQDSSEIIHSTLYANKARMINMVSDAVLHQKNEIQQQQKVTNSAHEALKIKTQEKKIHHKLTEKSEGKLKKKMLQSESLEIQESCLKRYFSNN